MDAPAPPVLRAREDAENLRCPRPLAILGEQATRGPRPGTHVGKRIEHGRAYELRRIARIGLVALGLFACGGTTGAGPSGEPAPRGGDDAELCPATAPAPDPLPGVRPEHTTLAYWLERSAELGDLDAPLLTTAQIAMHDRALTRDPDNGLPIDRGSLLHAPDPARLEREVQERLAYMREKIASGEYVDAAGARLVPAASAAFQDATLSVTPELRVATGSIELRCGPRTEGLYKVPVDPAFDRNNCSTVRAQEALQILMRWPNGMRLARTRYSLGWIADDAPLSPPIAGGAERSLVSGATLRAPSGTRLAAADGASLTLPSDALLPTDAEGHALFADASGVHAAPATGLPPTARPLTRRAVLDEAFARLDQPYGWGGNDGGLDCSRFVMDVLATFGLELPRHSGRQATSGTYTIELAEVVDGGERERLIDAAARHGVVLLHFPGHIMLYLGRDAEGTQRTIHAFSEYVEPCDAEGEETLRRVDKVTVTDLALGAGSSRRSFLERLTQIVILGQQVGPELIGVATPRAPVPVEIPETRACEDSLDVRVFRSPEQPNVRQPLRVFVTSTHELGPVQLALVDPEGRRHTPTTRRLGGPPFTYWAEIEHPTAGRWRAALGDGASVAACETITVSPYPARPEVLQPDVVWTPRFRWEADTEALYAAFVEQLFDYPIEEELTWPNLSVLLADRSRNILFDHFGQSEESRIPLQPDCADLPYFLRTYFSWKMRLPFAFRSCTRGRHGDLPVCDEELRTPHWEHGQVNAIEAFRSFILTQVKRGVHSASGRTHPADSSTPLYPVPMTRDALRPGTVFADPYGHLLVVARWLPQGADHYGILIGADAQPDGTVGRRRFWRGSFLFDPDTTHVGAGFKAWRPVVYERRDDSYRTLANEEITERAGYVPFSMQQYEGTADDYYDRMEALINPRPLDPTQVQVSLVDALDESIARRVVSVQNGEDWVRQNPGRTMEMPVSGAIFQSGGPWEDFSTPSRDMRLLIAIDTVLAFPDVVRRNPGRFGLDESGLEAAVTTVTARRDEELRARRFRYTRSNGQVQELSLADVAARRGDFEISYNPNDCVEIRWAAPGDSDEMHSCARHAPAEQRERMAEYREWFATRRRPIW